MFVRFSSLGLAAKVIDVLIKHITQFLLFRRSRVGGLFKIVYRIFKSVLRYVHICSVPGFLVLKFSHPAHT